MYMYVLLLAASVCWLVYGWSTDSKPVYVSAVVQTGLISAVLAFKLLNVIDGVDDGLFSAL